MAKTNIFEEAYNLCAKQLNKYPSEYFKKYLDSLYKDNFFDNPLRQTVITGYFLRCAEVLIGTNKPKKADDDLKAIINSENNNFERIVKLANFLDKNDKLGPSRKVLSYSLIPADEVEKFIEIYANDSIKKIMKENKLKKGKENDLIELTYRNVSFGYIFKLSEELVEGARK